VINDLIFFLDKIMSRQSRFTNTTPAENPMTKDKTTRSSPKVTWEHSWSSNETQSGLADSPFRAVPTEVMLHIFKFLSVHDLGIVSSLCRSFKMIADQDEIWKLKCKCKFIHLFFSFHL
jgi:hypothetical protein